MRLQPSAVTAASLLLATLLSWPAQAQASWREQLPAAELVGEGTLRYFGLRIYDARLWSAAADFDPQKAFALELTYHRSISRDALVATSMEELRRLADADEPGLRRRRTGPAHHRCLPA